jgi:hypothetical protein
MTMCQCGLEAWRYGTGQCCTERMLRAMPTATALYLLERVKYDVSEAFRNEYREHWNRHAATRRTGPGSDLQRS